MKKILLIGFRGSGKSTVGKQLAFALGVPFIDADEEIEKNIGKTIKEIVAEKGWEFFRKLEREFLKSLLSKDNLVCALGGGAVLHKEEMKELKKESLIIWLDADIEVIKRRLKKDEKTATQRPALTKMTWEEELESLYKEREPFYKNWADFQIDSSFENPEVLANKIINLIKEALYGKYYCRGY
ncbi:MAG: shikimate kinase [Caldimicrobium sp.]